MLRLVTSEPGRDASKRLLLITPKQFFLTDPALTGLNSGSKVKENNVNGKHSGTGPAHTSPAWHAEPPRPAGREQAHVLGSRLPPSWTGAGCP
ncbi:unnamed protein product, partial [Rangifer tarandus platyrhynchus]